MLEMMVLIMNKILFIVFVSLAFVFSNSPSRDSVSILVDSVNYSQVNNDSLEVSLNTLESKVEENKYGNIIAHRILPTILLLGVLLYFLY